MSKILHKILDLIKLSSRDAIFIATNIVRFLKDIRPLLFVAHFIGLLFAAMSSGRRRPWLGSEISLLSFMDFVFIKWLRPTHASQKYAIWAQNSPNLPRVVRSFAMTVGGAVSSRGTESPRSCDMLSLFLSGILYMTLTTCSYFHTHHPLVCIYWFIQ